MGSRGRLVQGSVHQRICLRICKKKIKELFKDLYIFHDLTKNWGICSRICHLADLHAIPPINRSSNRSSNFRQNVECLQILEQFLDFFFADPQAVPLMNRSWNKSPSWAHLVFTDLPATPLIAKTYDWSSEWAVPLTTSHICFCRSLDRTSDVERFLCKISGSTFRVDKVSKDLSEALHNSPADLYIGEVIIRWWKSRRPSYCVGVSVLGR